MKIAQFIFRFLCLAVPVFQLMMLINNNIKVLNTDQRELIELSDSDTNEDDNEEDDLDKPKLEMISEFFQISNMFEFKGHGHFHSFCYFDSTFQQVNISVPYSPPELLIF
jgi:hypothetical protein